MFDTIAQLDAKNGDVDLAKFMQFQKDNFFPQFTVQVQFIVQSFKCQKFSS